MRQVFDRISRVAKTELPVLVLGPTGSGKELAARAIHETSGRSGAFVAVNCGALASSLVESELFGHVKGAFTGALSDREGVFEAANQGTLFLDEIGELPIDLQPRLLRVLETLSVRRIGDSVERPVDVRIVAATHRDLEEMVRQGKFREDLLHRLKIVPVVLPALKDRPEDILAIARSILAEDRKLTSGAEAALVAHDWPGNIRELRNTLLRAQLLSDGDIEADALELPVPARPSLAPPVSIERSHLTLVEEKSLLLETLEACGNNRSRAARRLGLSRSAFHERLRKFGVPHRFSAEEAIAS